MAAFCIRYKQWVRRPELNVQEGPFFDVYPKEEGHLIRCINVLLSSSDIQNLKHEMHIEGPEGDARLQSVVIRYAIQRIEQGLNAAVFPNPPNNTTDNLFITQDDYPILRQLFQGKTCEYQLKEGRELLCSAASADNASAHTQRGFQFIAPTTQALCRACTLPDTDYLCSHFSHPKVLGLRDRGTVVTRQLAEGLCNIGRHEVNQYPEQCRAGGHECWERLIESAQQALATSSSAPSETIMARIFLCHASEDKPHVRKIYQQLKALGFAPWLDEVDILPGQDWNYEIERALKASDFVLVFLSTRSVRKTGYVQREFRRALYHAEERPEGFIHTIPVKLDNCSAPHHFSQLQWVNLYEDGAFDRVVNAIRHGLQQRGQPVPQQYSQQQNTYDEQEILALIPYSLTSALNDRKLERRLETFSFVQDNLSIHKYARQELDDMAISQRERLFIAAPEMEPWWRGKSSENGAWPLFRVKGGTWISKEQIKQVPVAQQGAFWEIPGLLEWYMRDEVF